MGLDKEVSHSFHLSSCAYGRREAPIWLSGGETADVFCFQAYMDTLQTQWSWILQITKCIDVHLKENAAYFQVFILSNNLIVLLVTIPYLLNDLKSTENNVQSIA